MFRTYLIYAIELATYIYIAVDLAKINKRAVIICALKGAYT